MRTFLQLSQNDSRWAGSWLGNSTSVTLGAAGCYVTSFAVAANYYGHVTDPSDMNNRLKAGNLFASSTYISNDDDLQQIFPDCLYKQTYHYEAVKADLVQLQQLLQDPTLVVIVEIDLGNGSVHFSPVADCNASTVTIMNVWDGKLEDLGSVYGDPATKILKFVVYQGTPVSADDPIVCDKKSVRDMLVTKATSLDTIGSFLHYGSDVIQTVGFGDVVVNTIKELQKEVANIPVSPAQSSTPTTNIAASPSVNTDPVVPATPPASSSPSNQPDPSFLTKLYNALQAIFVIKGVSN